MKKLILFSLLILGILQFGCSQKQEIIDTLQKGDNFAYQININYRIGLGKKETINIKGEIYNNVEKLTLTSNNKTTVEYLTKEEGNYYVYKLNKENSWTKEKIENLKGHFLFPSIDTNEFIINEDKLVINKEYQKELFKLLGLEKLFKGASVSLSDSSFENNCFSTKFKIKKYKIIEIKGSLEAKIYDINKVESFQIPKN